MKLASLVTTPAFFRLMPVIYVCINFAEKSALVVETVKNLQFMSVIIQDT